MTNENIDKYGRDSFLKAALDGDLEKFEGEYKACSNPFASVDKYKCSALHIAAIGGNRSIIQFLLDKGFDVNSVDSFGATALHLLAIKGYSEATKILLAEKDIDINARDKNGETPLMVAAKKGHRRTLYNLLAAGADVSVKNNKGESLMDVAMPSTKALLMVYKKDMTLEELKAMSIPLEVTLHASKATNNTKTPDVASKANKSGLQIG